MKNKKIILISIIIAIIAVIAIVKVCYQKEDSVYTKKYVGGKFNQEKMVNTPKLAEGMKAIKWENGEVVEVKQPEKDSSWYNYENGQWANAMTQDGSMWVWIPRYAYQISEGYNTNRAGKINIEFLVGTTNDTASGIKLQYSEKSGENNWLVHPAFTNTKEKLGIGWDTDIYGFWVAKFEAGDGTIKSEVSYGTNGTRTSKIKNKMGEKITYPVFMPGKVSVNYTNSNDMYTISKRLTNTGNPYGFNKEDVESMQIKNTQWGAIAYLTQSKYGTNGNIIEVNTTNIEKQEKNSTAKSGGEDYKTNIKQSSTGTIYGVYDLAGGAWERVAAILDNDNPFIKVYNYKMYKDKDTKYIDKYTVAKEDKNQNNYNINSDKYGDAIWEVSNSSGVWNNNTFEYPSGNAAIFRRGGNFEDKEKSGIYALYMTAGCETNSNSCYRVVLVNK